MDEILNGASLEALKATWFDLEMEMRRITILRQQVEVAINKKAQELALAQHSPVVEETAVGE